MTWTQMDGYAALNLREYGEELLRAEHCINGALQKDEDRLGAIVCINGALTHARKAVRALETVRFAIETRSSKPSQQVQA